MPEPLSEEEAKQWVASDLKNMVWHGAKLRNETPPRFHYEMADFIQGARPEWISTKKVILGFRFAAKTWLAARQYLKFRWLRCPLMQVVVHSSNDGMAKKFVKAIKEEMEYDPLMGAVRAEPSSSDFEFNLQGVRPEQGYSIVAAGIKTSLKGSRSDIYIFDDPEPETDPEPLRERIVQAFDEASSILHVPDRHIHMMKDVNGVTPTIVPVPERTQLLVLGQPNSVTTAYIPSDLDEDEDSEGHPLRDAKFLKIPVINRKGEWRWPDMARRKWFNWEENRPKTPKEVRRGMTTSRWELQYMINTGFAALAGPVLRVGEIEPVYAVTGGPIVVVDPADSETGSEWGVTCLGLRDHRIHIHYLGGFHAEAFEGDDWESMGQSAWRKVFDVAEEFRARRVFVEKNLKAAITACRRYIAKNEVHCVVHEFAVTRNKRNRIPELLEQPINNRMVSCNPGVLTDRENVRQLKKLRWDKLPNPCDRIDVLAAGFEILMEEPHLVSGGDIRRALPSSGKRPPSYRRMETAGNSFARIR